MNIDFISISDIDIISDITITITKYRIYDMLKGKYLSKYKENT